jgi:hypothetical protein
MKPHAHGIKGFVQYSHVHSGGDSPHGHSAFHTHYYGRGKDHPPTHYSPGQGSPKSSDYRPLKSSGRTARTAKQKEASRRNLEKARKMKPHAHGIKGFVQRSHSHPGGSSPHGHSAFQTHYYGKGKDHPPTHYSPGQGSPNSKDYRPLAQLKRYIPYPNRGTY